MANSGRSAVGRASLGWMLLAVALGSIAATSRAAPPAPAAVEDPAEQVLRGRQLVISQACGDCHGGMANPAAADWLIGAMEGPAVVVLGEMTIRPRNLTPDPTTGIGRWTDRQLFNALRYGLRPSATPDVEITSTTPGQGNYPAEPSYLAPMMPWQAFRHMADGQLEDIIAYLRHGVRPVEHELPENPTPPDRWAGPYAPERIGPHPGAPFPTANEAVGDPARREQLLRGRQVVMRSGCGDCHGGGGNPAAPGWLAGLRGAELDAALGVPPAGDFEMEFDIGPFKTRPRNLTPDNLTGMGRFSERQIFNALRYGLRPGETADVEITSTTPGVGNHPAQPKYLAPPMPWTAFRHLPDDELWAVAAYLKHGVRPVRNLVADSDGPPDFWASLYTPEAFGAYPAPPFPTGRERPRVAAR